MIFINENIHVQYNSLNTLHCLPTKTKAGGILISSNCTLRWGKYFLYRLY